MVERYGYRYALMFNYVLIMPFIAISAFSRNLPMLFVGGLLQGIPFGVFSTLVSKKSDLGDAVLTLAPGMRLRLRSHSSEAQRLAHRVDQHQLGSWSSFRNWDRQCDSQDHVALGLPSRIHDPVDLADPLVLPHVGLAGRTLVAGTQRPVRRCGKSGEAIDFTFHAYSRQLDRSKHDQDEPARG